jgi:CRISPR/Cas system CSM-associated protein Csm3 (group 7 of RAMP superfamily)
MKRRLTQPPQFFTNFPMKSAYELAMERLEQKSPTAILTPEQKERIAEVESIAQSKIAEKELFLKEQIAKALFSGDHTAAVQLEQQLANEIARIQSDAEAKRAAIRGEKQA